MARKHIACLLLVLVVFLWPAADEGKQGEGKPPIQVDGLHVLILYESEDWDSMTPSQVEIIQSARQAGELRKWLEANAEDFRVYDDDVDASNAPRWVQDALAIHDGSTPWMLAADSDGGYVGSLPSGVKDVKELLRD